MAGKQDNRKVGSADQSRPAGAECPSARSAQPRWAVPAAAALLVLAGAVVYANSFSGVFVFDDQHLVFGRAEVWEHGSFLRIWREIPQAPLLSLSLALNYRLGGTNVWGYHLFNVVVHVLAGLTLFGLLRRTLAISDVGFRIADSRPESLRNPQSAIRNTVLAVVAALLWLVHPLQTQAVTYIAQRREAMMALCYLLTLYCLVRGRTGTRNPELGTWKGDSSATRFGFRLPGSEFRIPSSEFLWLAAAVVACGLGMWTKPVMVTAPVMALLYDRTFLSGSFRNCLRRGGWLLYLLLAATWLLLWSPVRQYQVGGLASENWQHLTVADYSRSQFGVVLHYFRLCFWPSGLCLDYGWPAARQPWQYLPQAIIVVSLLGVTAWLFFKRSPALGFLGVWFFGILAPSSSIILVNDLAYEHRAYLSSSAVVTAAVLGAFFAGRRLLARLPAGCARTLAAWVLFLAVPAAAATALGAATISRNLDYRSPLAFWRDAVSKYPDNPRSRCSLGTYLFNSGDYDGAIAHFTRAIELLDNYAEAYFGRGLAYGASGRYDQAAKDCQAATLLNPKYVDAHYHLGLALTSLGRPEQAVAAYSDAIRLKAGFALAYANRAIAYAQMGRPDQAASDYNLAVELGTDEPKVRQAVAEGYVKRAQLRGQAGENAPAVQDLDRAIGLKPDYGQAYSERAVGYFYLKDYARAWADVEQARKYGCPPRPEFLKALSVASGRIEAE